MVIFHFTGNSENGSPFLKLEVIHVSRDHLTFAERYSKNGKPHYQTAKKRPHETSMTASHFQRSVFI